MIHLVITESEVNTELSVGRVGGSPLVGDTDGDVGVSKLVLNETREDIGLVREDKSLTLDEGGGADLVLSTKGKGVAVLGGGDELGSKLEVRVNTVEDGETDVVVGLNGGGTDKVTILVLSTEVNSITVLTSLDLGDVSSKSSTNGETVITNSSGGEDVVLLVVVLERTSEGLLSVLSTDLTGDGLVLLNLSVDNKTLLELVELVGGLDLTSSNVLNGHITESLVLILDVDLTRELVEASGLRDSRGGDGNTVGLRLNGSLVLEVILLSIELLVKEI